MSRLFDLGNLYNGICQKKAFSFMLVACMTIGFFNCKSEQSKPNELSPSSKKVGKKQECNIRIKGVFLQTDSFELFYEINALSHFSQDNSLKRGFTGSKEEQELLFDLEGVYPEKIRIDLGSNPNQNTVEITEIMINYDQRELRIDSINFLKYFTPNEYIKYEGAQLRLIKKSIDEKEFYDPYLSPTPQLIKALIDL